VGFLVQQGDYLSIIGPNGAGKTTLLKCLDRIWTGATGSIRVHGRELADYAQKELARVMSYVPQADGRFFPFSVREFVMMGRYPHLSPFTSVGSDDEKVVDEALELTGMVSFCTRAVNTLSGGERQKLFIAAAVAQGAEILLLDEPTTFLDPKHQAEIHRVLRELNRSKGATIVSVTHDINSAALASNRILGLKEGSVVYDGPAADVMNNEVLSRIFDKEFLFVEHPGSGGLLVVPDGVE